MNICICLGLYGLGWTRKYSTRLWGMGMGVERCFLMARAKKASFSLMPNLLGLSWSGEKEHTTCMKQTHMCAYIHIHIHTHTHTYTNTYIHKHIHENTHVRMHKHTHTHINTQTPTPPLTSTHTYTNVHMRADRERERERERVTHTHLL